MYNNVSVQTKFIWTRFISKMATATISLAQIAGFVAALKNEHLEQIFSEYKQSVYGHLMDYPITPESDQNKKTALIQYLNQMIFVRSQITYPEGTKSDKELRIFGPIIQNLDFDAFISTLQQDQFYQEPLYEILNKLSH